MMGSNAVTVFNYITLFLGSGIFVVLLRTMFILGQYAQRISHLETSVSSLVITIEKLRERIS
jgi:hypothetical protein